MTTGTQRGRGGARRGVILILVLGVLGLMAVIGVTFATFTGQARMAARSFAQSKIRPQSEALMDFALGQLICDTNDVRSAIRGHSLARDMYGNDAIRNGLLDHRSDGAQTAPNSDAFFYVTQASVNAAAGAPLYDLATNIPAGDPLFYGYNFNRWTVKIAFIQSAAALPRVITQSFEVVNDSGFVPGSSDPRILTVVIRPEDAAAQINNPTAGITTIAPAQLILGNLGVNLGTQYRMTLDGRWMHAFNGPGKTNNAKYGNFRYNLDDPATAGMDEDYDAVDLENWFLAMQSADGKLIIPSFHRPGVVRYDQTGLGDIGNDWSNTVDTSLSAQDQAIALRDKMSRILRPRRADGNDPAAFPDLVPDGKTGKIQYDVDNDGDGLTDSVWVDLGYPARRNAQGRLYKPLFAFMVIGLNGRIPLNTAGNLAARGGAGNDTPQSGHATHLGNSVSEIDPSYGLQNAFKGLAQGYDQYDNSLIVSGVNMGVDVRLTQLRNILAGTRPQPNPSAPDATGLVNGDANWVGTGIGKYYYMPNGIKDAGDVDVNQTRPPAGNVVRMNEAVPGRWGEADSVTGGAYSNLSQTYTNEVRPGYSISVRDIMSGGGRPLDSADDNYNSFDVYPVPDGGSRIGEVGDYDYYDASGSLAFAVERLRRFVAPIDTNGSGRVTRYNGRGSADRGGDRWGRVEYRGYYRPPGLPGQIDPASGAVSFWSTGGGPYAYPNQSVTAANVAAGAAHNNNMLHGFDSYLVPNTRGTPQRSGGILAYQQMTDNTNTDTYMVPGIPTEIPSYDGNINSGENYTYNIAEVGDPADDVTINSRSDGLNEADEMNLYEPNELLDSPYGYSDLEWLYRAQDVDGKSLSSRLSQLAPISFANTADGLRHRRLYSIDTWESTLFSRANDNPMGFFGGPYVDLQGNNQPGLGAGNSVNYNISLLTDGRNDNARMGPTTYTPGLAQRGRKINLNAPLPVSNDPFEPIRQKWISDAYQFMKAVLPPRAVDTPEELAQLGQYLVNVIDFRDPDCTMTIWDNPDVRFVPTTVPTAPPTLISTNADVAAGGTHAQLRHYGMEYNPVAINEVLAFSYARKNGTTVGNGLPTGRFFIELANTLSRPGGGATADNNASVINLSGYDPTVSATTPYAGGCWDMVFTGDATGSRPDPFTGQLQPGAQIYGITPLAAGAIASKTGQIAAPTTAGVLLRGLPRQTAANPPLTVIGFSHPAGAANEGQSEHGSSGITQLWSTMPPFAGSGQGTMYQLNTTYDPFNTATAAPGLSPPPAGVLPNNADGTPATSFTPLQIPRAAASGAYYWVHLRRPANPMLAVSATNPMVVVDSMRFPYVDVGGTVQTTSGTPPKVDNVTKSGTDLYSYQRLQPYRGGQAVPWNPTTVGAIDPRYGYTEQIAASVQQIGNMAVFYGDTNTQTGSSGSANGQVSRTYIYNTLGQANDGTNNPSNSEYWDWFPFHDRDFTSPYELTLVPGVGPGLFTKRFAEFAPTADNASGFTNAAAGNLTTNYAAITTPPTNPGSSTAASARAAQPFLFRGSTSPIEPHSYPYLIDKFFYTAANPPVVSATPLPTDDVLGDTVGGYAADGWHRMFEYFEVPSQSAGATGMVQNGVNFDWARQDARPGQLNLNLIIDEEVFLGLLGKHNATYDEQLLDMAYVPTPGSLGLTEFKGGVWQDGGAGVGVGPIAAGYPPIPMIVTAANADGSPAYVQPMENQGSVAIDPATSVPANNLMKASFAQFLWARHGGSGFLFGFGAGATGQNQTTVPVAITPPYSGLPAERPFRSPTYPDVDYTPMRPATLPPSAFTDPPYNPAVPVNADPVVDDPGVRNQRLFAGRSHASWAGSTATVTTLPPPIPARRLFQPADDRGLGGASPSNAGLLGDPTVNVLQPLNAGNPTIGGLPGGGFGEGGTNLFQVGAKLGDGGGKDMTQHPYFRSEQMQRIANLTTVRTHQYAVWITIGFFEVKREGDPAMVGSAYPNAAFDTLGAEIDAAAGRAVRYRSFFVVDRLKLTGFDPNAVGAFRPAVVYRKTIQ